MSDEKPWVELTPQERAARMAAGKAKKAAERAAAVEAAGTPEPAPIGDPPPLPMPEPEPEDEPEEEEAEGVHLSEKELARIRKEAEREVGKELARVRAAEREALIAKTLDAEILARRRDAGLTSHLDDEMEILIDVAPFANELIIDGVRYQHARWYKVDRRRYESIREIMARGWDSEDRAGNPNQKFHRWVAGSMNPMQHERRMDDGTFTVGLDTRISALTGATANVPGSV